MNADLRNQAESLEFETKQVKIKTTCRHTHLLQLIDPLSGLDGHVKEAQYAPHNVHDGVGHLRGGADVTDVPPGVGEQEGLGELGGEVLSNLRGGHEVVFLREAIELIKLHV